MRGFLILGAILTALVCWLFVAAPDAQASGVPASASVDWICDRGGLHDVGSACDCADE